MGAERETAVDIPVRAGAGRALPAPAEAAPQLEPRRLWLHGSLASSPGALGFFVTACREPQGSNLRLLLDYDLPGAVPPVTGVPQPLLGACRSVPQRELRMDTAVAKSCMSCIGSICKWRCCFASGCQ